MMDATFGDQLLAALLDLVNSDAYKSATGPDAHHQDDFRQLSQSGLGHKKGYMCALMQYAQGDVQVPIDDDIDADSDDPGETDNDCRGRWGTPTESIDQLEGSSDAMPGDSQNGFMSVPGTTTGAGTVLVAGDGEAKFDFRITRIPYDLPELVPDKAGVSATTSQPSIPTTPSVDDDIFRPLASFTLPDLKLELFKGFEVEPPKFSFDQSGRQEATKRHHHLAPSTSTTQTSDSNQSMASMRTGTTSSSDEQPPQQRVKSSFSRLRNSVRSTRFPSDEDHSFIEKRSLTPYGLSRPSQQQQQSQDDSLFDRPLPPLPYSSSDIGFITDRRPSATPTIPDKQRAWQFGKRKQKEPGAVFGVELEKSIKTAPTRIRISHNGRANSHRAFPLSVYKCCEFIRFSDTKDVALFSSPGDAFNLDQLRRIFSSPPDYGESFSFDGTDYTVYDAARLITIYLTELPQPLVSRSVLKSWVLLARQHGAIEPPCPQRIETGLDFWAEALNRLPVANRNLVKHLLSLFAEVLTKTTEDWSKTEISEAEARQFSAGVSRALFHLDDSDMSAKNAVHPTLALAFIIRKRGEYLGSLDKQEDKSGKGKRDSSMFLPSTQEMMQWKAPGLTGA
ncbi:Rho GTPase activation protein [Apodospora peruviana]|uniref:Rho GTPase activation protein n=1 Tax=Apodospora peruviana TaxID=516989 RepID=A0AAE0LYN1_9PEZI|nr:Rho GTPase activation protein [Apodospora peruviana]